MDLYYSPMACSLAARIALYEADIPTTFHSVQLSDKSIQGGGALRAISPKEQVPVLVTDDGRTLTENLSILQFIADARPQSRLAPRWDHADRYALQSWLSYVATEVHKTILWVSFAPATPAESKAFVQTLIPAKLDVLEAHLKDRATLVGDDFTVADAYLIWALALLRHLGANLKAYPAVNDYVQRMRVRDAVKRAFEEESRAFAA